MTSTSSSRASNSTASSTRADPTIDSKTQSQSRNQSEYQRYSKYRKGRPRTAISTVAGLENQRVICALCESRGISPTIGIAFVNLDTCCASLCQISDSQTYVKTIHQLNIHSPSEVLFMSTAVNPKSKLFSVIEEELEGLDVAIISIARRLWAEDSGLEYVQQLALSEDVETIQLALTGNYFAVCSFAAALKYIEQQHGITFAYHSLRVKYEPPDGSMMIDISTIHTLELIQNMQDPKSKHCLFGLLNEGHTAMGSRCLRSNILQPLTNSETLFLRLDALEELTNKEEMFFGVRQALKDFVDVDRLLSSLVLIPVDASDETLEQNINNVIMLRHFILSVRPIFESLKDATGDLLSEIRGVFCSPRTIGPIRQVIDAVINEDVKYSKSPLDLLNQRTFAVRSGLNGLLDVSRQTFKENSDDASSYIARLCEETGINLELKYDPQRRFYIRLRADNVPNRQLPADFINVVKKKDRIECSTMILVKRNSRIKESHDECIKMSDAMVQNLIIEIRTNVSALFKICEAVAMLDMLAGFAQIVTTQGYIRPTLDQNALAIKAGRHPIKEKIQRTKFVPNDVYATQQSRFQIITGCNMSGKSTYIRSIALISVMAQIGSFVPAEFATIPIHNQLFARVSVDDSIEGNVSTFAAEMKETAFILRNIDRRSIAIIDELGRGTSTTDGLAIAIAVSEALVDSKAMVWFATHFTDLAKILAERSGVTSLHLAVSMPNENTMKMLYKVAAGTVAEEHYGLALARVLPLPPAVLEHAAIVAQTLRERVEKRRKTSPAVIVQRRRRLILKLKEHLIQARNGNMHGTVLREWLTQLQRQFVERMVLLDEQAARAEEDDEDEGMYNEMEVDGVDEVDDGASESTVRELHALPANPGWRSSSEQSTVAGGAASSMLL